MNVFRAMAVKDVDEATRAIPVIDFAPAFLGQAGGLDAVAGQVRHGCETVGFFYLAGHGVPGEVVDAAFAASRGCGRMSREVLPVEVVRVAEREHEVAVDSWAPLPEGGEGPDYAISACV